MHELEVCVLVAWKIVGCEGEELGSSGGGGGDQAGSGSDEVKSPMGQEVEVMRRGSKGQVKLVRDAVVTRVQQ